MSTATQGQGGILLYDFLGRLLEVLKEEKDVLLKEDGVALEEIVQKKERLLKTLKMVNINPEEIIIDEAMEKRFKEIQFIQETNILLTKKTLNYHKYFFKLLGVTDESSNTYNKQGTYGNQKNQARIVNESV
jgi:flagellar biosynthesis/type III secretory pathway chaperone